MKKYPLLPSFYMSKYLIIFNVSWQNEFVYRLNFILWRFRVVLYFLLVYFLWTGVFSSHTNVFGYSRPDILTYIFVTLFVGTLVRSQLSLEIGAEIANGNITNYFIRPVGYLKYWFTRDIANKLLNTLFSIFEIGLLFVILKPEIKLPSDPLFLLLFSIVLISAVVINFFIGVLVRSIAFWSPDNTWAATFFFMVIADVLSGVIFPLDIAPGWVYTALQFTPFPYMSYFPTVIFIEKFDLLTTLRIVFQSLIWTVIAASFTLWVWRKGLKAYAAEGK